MSALDLVPRHRESVLAQEAQGQTVLLNPDDGSYYALEDVGARIWELCDGERSLRDVAAVLATEFDASSQAIQADVVEFVAELCSEQLLVAAG